MLRTEPLRSCNAIAHIDEKLFVSELQYTTTIGRQRTEMNEYECSACGAMHDKPSAVCPNCNSRMGKAKYDTSWVDEMADYDEIFGDGDD